MSEDILYYNQVACAEDFVAVAKYLENGGIPMDFDTYVEHFGYGLSDEDVTAKECCDMLDDNTDQDLVSFLDSVLLDSTKTDLLCQSMMWCATNSLEEQYITHVRAYQCENNFFIEVPQDTEHTYARRWWPLNVQFVESQWENRMVKKSRSYRVAHNVCTTTVWRNTWSIPTAPLHKPVPSIVVCAGNTLTRGDCTPILIVDSGRKNVVNPHSWNRYKYNT